MKQKCFNFFTSIHTTTKFQTHVIYCHASSLQFFHLDNVREDNKPGAVEAVEAVEAQEAVGPSSVLEVDLLLLA